MTGQVGPRIAVISAIVTVAVGAIGFVVMLALNAFVLDEFNEYGEIPIPGSGKLHLPAGEVTINFHTVVTGSSSSNFPIPPLTVGITPPDGVPDPVLTESGRSMTTVNSDVRVQIWVAQIPADGVYGIETDGRVDGYINPQLAFGRDGAKEWLLFVFGGLFVVGIAGLTFAQSWSRRVRRKAQPLRGPVILDEPTWPGPLPPPIDSYQPSDQGVRLEQLRTLAALRDSGALTDAEFEAEKRRILDG